MEELNKLKEEANARLLAGDAAKAVELYSAALDKCDADTSSDATALAEFAVAVQANRAAAHLKVESWGAALADATAVIDAQPDHIKAHHRRAAAHIGYVCVDCCWCMFRYPLWTHRSHLTLVLPTCPVTFLFVFIVFYTF